MQGVPGRPPAADVSRGAQCIFVYGSLMPGEISWPVLQPFARTWAAATARGHLYDTGMGYPAARFAEDDPVINGFVVALRPERLPLALRILDRFEGEGMLYRRICIATSGGPAFSYEWLGSTDGLVFLADGWPAAAPAPPAM